MNRRGDVPFHHARRDESESGEKLNALRSKSSIAMKREAPVLESGPPDAAPSLRPELSWTHYRPLLGVGDSRAREWYLRDQADRILSF